MRLWFIFLKIAFCNYWFLGIKSILIYKYFLKRFIFIKDIKIIKFELVLIFNIESPNFLYFILIIEIGNRNELKINCVHMWRFPLYDFFTSSWIIWAFINSKDQSIIFVNQYSIFNQSEYLWSLPYLKHILHVYFHVWIFLNQIILLWIWNIIFMHVQSVYSMIF